MSDKKDKEKPTSSKAAAAALKVKLKEGKKKLENKLARTDLLAKKEKINSRRRSRSSAAKKGKRASGGRSSSLPPYPSYEFEKYLEKTDPNVVLAKWLEREHTPIEDWADVATIIKVPREDKRNQEEGSEGTDSTSTLDDQEVEPKLNKQDEKIEGKGETVAALAGKIVIGQTEPAMDPNEAIENEIPRVVEAEAEEVVRPREAAGDEIVVLHKMASLSTAKFQSSDDEFD